MMGQRTSILLVEETLGVEEEEYPFINKYLSFQKEPIVLVEEESCHVYDTDNEEDESMMVYDTDIEDVIEEEEGFVRKGGFGGEKDNIEDIVVVVSLEKSNKNVIGIDNDIYSTVDACPNAYEMWKAIERLKQDKEIEKVIDLENKFKVLDNIFYKTGQTIQMMNMLNNKCRTSFVKPEYLKKAKQANPRLYDIGCYNDNLALMLSPGSDEVICLEKESRSKLSDLIRPFDYAKLNSLYDLFVPQCEKPSKQRFFRKIKIFEMYKNVTQEIRDQLNAEAEAVQIILTGI
nr:hypothetical protein [Tanacetum cinerariifolium]